MPLQYFRKYRKHIKLALLIESISVKMLQYSYCKKHFRNYIVSEGNSAKCNKCIYCKIKCNIEGFSANDIASLLKEQNRLNWKKKKITSKLLCFQKQKKFLCHRAIQIVQYGLKTLDKLDKVKEREKRKAVKQKEAGYSKLYSVNLTDSGEKPNLGGLSSDFPFLLQ